MASKETTKDIVLFETIDKKVTLEVPVEGETVWLTQAQMAELFASTKQNISLHIQNCFKEGELNKESVVKEFLTTALDGKRTILSKEQLGIFINPLAESIYTLLWRRRRQTSFIWSRRITAFLMETSELLQQCSCTSWISITL